LETNRSNFDTLMGKKIAMGLKALNAIKMQLMFRIKKYDETIMEL